MMGGNDLTFHLVFFQDQELLFHHIFFRDFSATILTKPLFVVLFRPYYEYVFIAAINKN